MLAAKGELIVFSDADLATPLYYIDLFREAVDRGCDVVIGSREGQGSERIGEPSYRHIMGRGFNLLVRLLVLPGIQDSQCGFKLFTREAAQNILARTLLYSQPDGVVQGPRVTAFDVELLVVARRCGYRICGMPVVWTYGKGSKVNPARDTWTNFCDVLAVKWNDVRGRYNHRP
jgi:dolichyl-phosphate beta-glucosyltransferase